MKRIIIFFSILSIFNAQDKIDFNPNKLNEPEFDWPVIVNVINSEGQKNDKQILTDESGLFLKFLENKMEYNTPSNVLEDLIKFQVFLLSTRDVVEEIKSETFQFDWKDFFVNNRNVLKPATKKYYFKNMIIESDPIKWNCQAVFWGRRARKYKAHPERVYEDKSFLEVDPLINEQKPAHSSNWDL